MIGRLFLALIALLVAIVLGIINLEDKNNNDDDPFVLTKPEQLPPKIAAWLKSGTMQTVNGYKMFTKKVGRDEDKRTPVVLFHGFPSSSYEFHRVVDQVAEELGPVLLFDHVGFGFSEKPRNDVTYKAADDTRSSAFSYSVIDHAENAITLMSSESHFNLSGTGCHVVAHDMGDSILAEILGRFHRGTLPSTMMGKTFFKSITFTNGGMIYKLSQPRVVQVLLATPTVGGWVTKLMNAVDSRSRLLSAQLRTVWPQQPPAGATPEQVAQLAATRDQDIADINTILHFNGGHKLSGELIRYINDRKMFEARWHPALARLHEIAANGRCQYLWGARDAVAPIDIAKTAHQTLGGGKCQFVTLEENGHFLQLEAPKQWVKAVIDLNR